jgi:hypothetical protein
VIVDTDRNYCRVRCTFSAVAPALHVGDPVEVHTKYNDSWVTGFEIAEVVDGGYRVRRTSDGDLLPNVTGEDDVRPLEE